MDTGLKLALSKEWIKKKKNPLQFDLSFQALKHSANLNLNLTLKMCIKVVSPKKN